MSDHVLVCFHSPSFVLIFPNHLLMVVEGGGGYLRIKSVEENLIPCFRFHASANGAPPPLYWPNQLNGPDLKCGAVPVFCVDNQSFCLCHFDLLQQQGPCSLWEILWGEKGRAAAVITECFVLFTL